MERVQHTALVIHRKRHSPSKDIATLVRETNVDTIS